MSNARGIGASGGANPNSNPGRLAAEERQTAPLADATAKWNCYASVSGSRRRSKPLPGPSGGVVDMTEDHRRRPPLGVNAPEFASRGRDSPLGPRYQPRALVVPRRPETGAGRSRLRSEEHTSELQSRRDLVCRLLLEKKKKISRIKVHKQKKNKKK